MAFIGELITLQCTKCGAKHQEVRGSNVIFILDSDGKVIKHGSNIYLRSCECEFPNHVLISSGYQKNELVPLWRDMSGNLHDPATMTTDYKFNVFLMIWNHSVPTHMRAHLPPYTRYTKFPKCYSKLYMKTMFNVMHKYLTGKNVIELNDIQHGLVLFVEQWLASGQCKFMKLKDSNDCN